MSVLKGEKLKQRANQIGGLLYLYDDLGEKDIIDILCSRDEPRSQDTTCMSTEQIKQVVSQYLSLFDQIVDSETCVRAYTLTLSESGSVFPRHYHKQIFIKLLLLENNQLKLDDLKFICQQIDSRKERSVYEQIITRMIQIAPNVEEMVGIYNRYVRGYCRHNPYHHLIALTINQMDELLSKEVALGPVIPPGLVGTLPYFEVSPIPKSLFENERSIKDDLSFLDEALEEAGGTPTKANESVNPESQ